MDGRAWTVGGACQLTVALALAVLALAPARAVADADPASDYLLASPVFYSYQPPTAVPLQEALESALSALRRRGLDLKVAIIAEETDLGAVFNLWQMPQQYAGFLDREISFNSPQALLVVMPAGFGTAHAGPAAALEGVTVDASDGADGLAQSAIRAVVRLAQADGRPIASPRIRAETPVATSSAGRGAPPLLTFGAPVLLVALAAALATFVRRRRQRGDS